MRTRRLLGSVLWLVPFAAVALLVPPIASGAELSIPLSAAEKIADGANQCLLLKFTLPDSLTNYRIVLAECEVPLLLDSCVGNAPSLIASPITRDWSPGTVAWDTAWATGGGNSTPVGSADVVLEGTGVVTSRFSVREWIRSATKGSAANYGFVLSSVGESKDGCSVIRIVEGTTGHVRVVFTR